MVHENQNHEDFDVKGGGRQRLRHVEGDSSFMHEENEKNNIQKTTSEYG